MNDHTRILEQLQRTYDGEPWYGPSLRAALDGMEHTRAAARPVAGAHTVWEIVRHHQCWLATVRRRLAGDPCEVADGDDWPAPPTPTEPAWLATLDVLDQTQQALVRDVAGLPEAMLHELVPGQRHTVAAMLHGVVQHAVYHAGQIALLRRALASAAETAG